jgi:DNA-binding response OmpR family regulator
MRKKMQKRILLLEDDLQLNATVSQFLQMQGYDVTATFDAHEARDRLYEQAVDLMLLDIRVPYQSGIDLLSEMRSDGDVTPAIFITSLSGVEDVERGFAAGGDDYIRKPFALKELSVRIESLLRRSYGSTSEAIDLGEGLVYDTASSLLLRDGRSVSLKTKELKLLSLFLQHANELIEYEKIYRALWDWDEEPNPASLRTYINSLRNELGREKIETIKNTGYRFVQQ